MINGEWAGAGKGAAGRGGQGTREAAGRGEAGGGGGVLYASLELANVSIIFFASTCVGEFSNRSLDTHSATPPASFGFFKILLFQETFSTLQHKFQGTSSFSCFYTKQTKSILDLVLHHLLNIYSLEASR